MALDVRTRRVYDEDDSGEGHRVLIDHVWPRGISRERARLDECRELAGLLGSLAAKAPEHQHDDVQPDRRVDPVRSVAEMAGMGEPQPYS